MEILKRVVPILALTLASGCDLLREPVAVPFTGEEVMVHAVLEAGADSALVRLAWVRGTGGAPRIEPLSGAVVELRSAGVQLRLEEAAEGLARCRPGRYDPGQRLDEPPATGGRGCYVAAVPGGIRAGEVYDLKVAIAGGPEIRGRAVVPDSPMILQPETEARLVLEASPGSWWISDPTPIRWRTPAGTGAIALAVQPDQIFEQGAPSLGARCEVPLVGEDGLYGVVVAAERTDSISRRAILTNCIEYDGATPVRSVLPDSVHARLRVLAYDTAFARYQQMVGGESVRRERAAVGLSGALGVFVGAAAAEQRLVLVIQMPD